MKKAAILFILVTIIACGKTKKAEDKNTSMLWAETVKTILPLERDSLWDKTDWDNAYKYDKEKILSSVVQAVSKGKLKAYSDYPGKPFSAKEFENLMVSWDSTAQVEDPNNPGVFISAPTKNEITAESISQLKFDEKIELDTVSYTLIKKVLGITFFTYKRDFDGNILGYKKLFDVRFDEKKDKNEEQ